MGKSFSAAAMRDARTARGLSVERLAIAVNRTSFTIRAWEAGRFVPPTPVLGELASALDVAIDDLFAPAGAPTAVTR